MTQTGQVIFTDSNISPLNEFNILTETVSTLYGTIINKVSLFTFKQEIIPNITQIGVLINLKSVEGIKGDFNDELKLLIINFIIVGIKNRIKITGSKKESFLGFNYIKSIDIKDYKFSEIEDYKELIINLQEDGSETIGVIIDEINTDKVDNYRVHWLKDVHFLKFTN
jgi:hypothetical protein